MWAGRGGCGGHLRGGLGDLMHGLGGGGLAQGWGCGLGLGDAVQGGCLKGF